MSISPRAPDKNGLSVSRRNQYLTVLREILKYAKEEGINVYDHALIKKFKEENKPVEVLTDEEVRSLLSSIKETCITKLRLKTFLICLLSTASRISAMLSLDRDDMDWKNGIVVCRGKGGKINQLLFDELSREYLRKYLDQRKDDCSALFATTNGKRWQVNCAERAVRNQGKRAGIKKRVYCHLARKTAASKMFFSGAPLPVVSTDFPHIA